MGRSISSSSFEGSSIDRGLLLCIESSDIARGMMSFGGECGDLREANGKVLDMFSWCSACGVEGGGFGVDIRGGVEPARKSADEDGDIRCAPGWWKSWPSACVGGNVSVAAIVCSDSLVRCHRQR